MKKIKSLKKLLASSLAIVLSLGLVACNQSGGDSKKTDGTKDQSTDSSESNTDEIYEVDWYNADGTADDWTDPIALKLTEKTGVKLNTTVPISQSDESVALMIAEQNYPDMLLAKGDTGALIEAGALIDLAPLIEEHAPNIKKMYGDQLDRLRFSKDDPAIYELTSAAAGPNTPLDTSGSALMQFQVLEANDYKIPEDLAEFEKMIKDFLAENPKTPEGEDYIGLSISVADWQWLITLGNPAGFIAEAHQDNGQWIVDENNKAYYKFLSPKIKEYMRWLNRMYQEGILDPQFATQTHEDYVAKIASGRVLALTDQFWDFQDATNILEVDKKYSQTYAPLPLNMEKGQKNATLLYPGINGYGISISKTAEDPVKLIKFLDYIASDEGQVLVQWGIEGEYWEYDENGKRVVTEKHKEMAETDPDYGKKTGIGRHNYPFPAQPNTYLDETGNPVIMSSKEKFIEDYNEAEKAAVKAWGVETIPEIFPQPDEFEIPDYPPLWTLNLPTDVTAIVNQLDEVAWADLVAMILDSPDNFDANYDAMLKKFEQIGVEEAGEMVSEILADKIAAAQAGN